MPGDTRAAPAQIDPGTEAAVVDLLDEHTAAVATTARQVRSAVLTAHPDLVERVRPGWHSINYRHPAAGFVCGIFPTTDRVHLVLERGAELPDPAGLLRGTGKQVRMLVFPAGDGVDGEVVGCYLDLAVDLGMARRRRPRR